MNILDAHVVEVIGEPEFKYGKWFVRVKVDCYGCVSETQPMFSTKEAAESLKVGDVVQI
tara:strand:+ start:1004 stop:1180 length:177 start_codon:yes stop_codon:yes gene_type:complete